MDYNEENISFPPTYKYILNTNNYNITKRFPSWTDWIFYLTNFSQFDIKKYETISTILSDHWPVCLTINYKDKNKSLFSNSDLYWN